MVLSGCRGLWVVIYWLLNVWLWVVIEGKMIGREY